MDQTDFLGQLLTLLDEQHIRYCVIDGQAVNAYVEPLVSLDLDLAIALQDVDRAAKTLGSTFHVERFPHSLNVSAVGSKLRVQIQTDPRYGDFVSRASVRDVLDLPLPVAAIEDVLQGKVWAAGDPGRRPSKRRKDLLDIERLIEHFPELRQRVPGAILDRLEIGPG